MCERQRQPIRRVIAALISFHVFTSNYHELDWAYHDNHHIHDAHDDHDHHDNNSSWSKSQIFSSKIFSKYFRLDLWVGMLMQVRQPCYNCDTTVFLEIGAKFLQKFLLNMTVVVHLRWPEPKART